MKQESFAVQKLSNFLLNKIYYENFATKKFYSLKSCNFLQENIFQNDLKKKR